MGSDDDGSLRKLLQRFLGFDDLNPFFFQILHYKFVVDNRSVGIYFLSGFYLFVDLIHGTLYTKAEAGAFCQNYFHIICILSFYRFPG